MLRSSEMHPQKGCTYAGRSVNSCWKIVEKFIKRIRTFDDTRATGVRLLDEFK